MNVKPVNYITKLKAPYQVGDSSYKYIGQLNISHIASIDNLNFHFTIFIRDLFINNEWSLDYNLYVNEAKSCNNESFAFLTCRDNRMHERVIENEKLDTLVYYNKRLKVQPSGFTNTQINTYIALVNYFYMCNQVSEFNSSFYPSYIEYKSRNEKEDDSSFRLVIDESSCAETVRLEEQKRSIEMSHSNDGLNHSKRVKLNNDDYLVVKLSNEINTSTSNKTSDDSNEEMTSTSTSFLNYSSNSETNRSTSSNLSVDSDKAIIIMFERIKEINKSLKAMVNRLNSDQSKITFSSETNHETSSQNDMENERVKIMNEVRLHRQFLQKLIKNESYKQFN